MTTDEATGIIRAAASDLLRVADDYDAEGLTGLSAGLRTRAVDLHLVATEMDGGRLPLNAGDALPR